MAKTQPTAAQWKEIEQRLGGIYDTVTLECDGYRVQLQLQRIGKMKLGISVYVGGWFRGEWLGAGKHREPSEEGRRFYPTHTRSVFRGEQKKAARRLWGKKRSEEKITYQGAIWSAVGSLRRHLVANNEHIRLVPEAELEAEREEREKAREAQETV